MADNRGVSMKSDNNMNDEDLLQKAQKEITDNEGSPKHAYADTKGNVTVGKGKKINNREEMKSINMLKDGRPATDSEKMAEYDRMNAAVKELGKNGDGTQPYNHTADKYEKFAKLELAPGEAERQTTGHMKKDLAAIRRKFPKFDSYSERRKLVIMDMQYNHGGFGKFPIFSKAVENGYWEIAAEHSKSGDISGKRNKWRYDGLLDK